MRAGGMACRRISAQAEGDSGVQAAAKPGPGSGREGTHDPEHQKLRTQGREAVLPEEGSMGLMTETRSRTAWNDHPGSQESED